MNTFAEIEQQAIEKQAQRQVLLDAGAAQNQSEQEKIGQDVLCKTLDFFMHVESIDHAQATSAITLQAIGKTWGRRFYAHFSIEGHLSIRAQMRQMQNGTIAYKDDQHPWCVSQSGHHEFHATLGEALIASTRIQRENAQWLASCEIKEAEEEAALLRDKREKQAALNVKVNAVRSLLERHPSAWRAITLLMLYYEV